MFYMENKTSTEKQLELKYLFINNYLGHVLVYKRGYCSLILKSSTL